MVKKSAARAEKPVEKAVEKAVEKGVDKTTDKTKLKPEALPEPTVPATAKPVPGKIAHPAEKTTRHLRAPIEIRVEITARSQSFTTTSRNIAIGGISFEAQQEFRVGDLVNVLLYIPVKKELDLLKVASEVVWVEDLKGSWMAGAAFRKFAPGDERRLRSWLIENVKAQKAGRSMP